METNDINNISPKDSFQSTSTHQKGINNKDDLSNHEDEEGQTDFLEEVETDSIDNPKNKIGFGWGWLLLFFLITAPIGQLQSHFYDPGIFFLYSICLLPLVFIPYFLIRKLLLIKKISRNKSSAISGLIGYFIALSVFVAFLAIDEVKNATQGNKIDETLKIHQSQLKDLQAQFIDEPSSDIEITNNINTLNKVIVLQEINRLNMLSFVNHNIQKCQKKSGDCDKFDELANLYNKLYDTSIEANKSLITHYETGSMTHFDRYIELTEATYGIQNSASVLVQEVFSGQD